MATSIKVSSAGGGGAGGMGSCSPNFHSFFSNETLCMCKRSIRDWDGTVHSLIPKKPIDTPDTLTGGDLTEGMTITFPRWKETNDLLREILEELKEIRLWVTS